MTKKQGEAKVREMEKALQVFPAEVRRQERAHRQEEKIRKAFGKISFASEASDVFYKTIKSMWKKLGINGQVKNFSSKELWVLENDSGKPIARRLAPGYKTPSSVDCDAFKRTDKKPIENHGNWWKFYDPSIAELYGKGDSVKTASFTKVAVKEDYFGRPIYRDENWGTLIQVVLDVKRNRKKEVVQYFISNFGWVSPETALIMTCRHEIDNARPVFPQDGEPYLRTRRDQDVLNNISYQGFA